MGYLNENLEKNLTLSVHSRNIRRILLFSPLTLTMGRLPPPRIFLRFSWMQLDQITDGYWQFLTRPMQRLFDSAPPSD